MQNLLCAQTPYCWRPQIKAPNPQNAMGRAKGFLPHPQIPLQQLLQPWGITTLWGLHGFEHL